jgi:hypothetical protein
LMGVALFERSNQRTKLVMDVNKAEELRDGLL